MPLHHPPLLGQNSRAATYKYNQENNPHTRSYDPVSPTTDPYVQDDLPAHGETPPPIDWISGGGKTRADAICTGPGLNKNRKGNAQLT